MQNIAFPKITFFQKVILWKSCGEVATWFKKLLLLKMSLYIEYYLTRVNNLDIKQKSAWIICFVIYPQHQTLGE